MVVITLYVYNNVIMIILCNRNCSIIEKGKTTISILLKYCIGINLYM